MEMIIVKESKTRISLYDNLRFLLILLVVVGHFAEISSSNSNIFGSIFILIYSFHMPLFLFLSGLFHKNENIMQKVLMYIFIGFLLKIVLFLESLILYNNSSFSLLSDTGIPWYMFVLSIYILISFLTRKIDKKFILLFSIMLACFSGYDSSIGDYLYLSRAIVFYPFFVLGQMVNRETLLNITRNKGLKITSFIILFVWLLACIFLLKNVYVLRPLFTGRNPFSINEIFIKWGFLYRILCYIITFFIGFSIICIVTDKKLPIITSFGKRTLQVYFWHFPILILLTKYIVPILYLTRIGKLIWLLCGVILTFIFSLKLFKFPIIQINMVCKYIKNNDELT